MNSKDKHLESRNSDEVESVLTFGNPRERPCPNSKQSVYDTVKSHWLSEVKTERRSRHVVLAGIAASVVLAASMAFYASQPPADTEPDLSAVLVRVTGDAVSANDVQIDTENYVDQTLRFAAGDVLATHGNSRAAVAWFGDGSLRIDHDTRISFLGSDRIRLSYGTIYYDSKTHGSRTSASAPLAIETSLGTVTHVGTQFIAGLSKSGLRISVREGDVKFSGGLHDFSVSAGTTVGISPDNSVEKHAISPTDREWKWAANIAPALIADGQSTLELILWVARQTGLSVRFESTAARNFAMNDRIVGLGRLTPMQALSSIPSVTNLRYVIDNETIIVSEKE